MHYPKQLLRNLTNKRYRRWMALAVLIVTALLVVRFFSGHSEYIGQLSHVPPLVIVVVILINIPAMAALAWAYDSMLRLCGTTLGVTENLLLTAYSSIINFFGPLQSGPGVRMVYLKSRHAVRIRDYVRATLLYYALFASLSALFLFVGMRPWWQTLGAFVVVASFSAFVLRMGVRQGSATSSASTFALRRGPLTALCIAVLLQCASVTAYYFVELRAVNPQISLAQAISYAGAANFSLFVSLTPDAIGFREAFLILSQHIHHVATADIVKANVIDRGAYLLYLGLLFLVVLTAHGRERLHLPPDRQ